MKLVERPPNIAATSEWTSRRAFRFASLGLALILVACAAEAPRGVSADPMTLRPPAPELRSEQLSPGLAVRYWFILMRDIRELDSWRSWQPGTAGAVLDGLDHVMGDGPVLTSGARDAVGAEITGFIHLSEAGRYSFLANSNDGVRAEIGGVVVANDPDVHGDRLSTPQSITVTQPGWYALRVLYFERRNTATLQLFWVTPSASAPALVPAGALRHR